MEKVTLIKLKRGARLQYVVAQEAGIIPSRYNMIENGLSKHVKAEDAERIARALGCSIEDLFVPSTFSPIETEAPADEQAAAAGG